MDDAAGEAEMAQSAARRQQDHHQDHIAHAEIVIDAPPEKVWKALTDPALVKDVMFGSEVTTDWKVGSPITWTGEWEGKPFEDKGEVVAFEPGKRLKTTHFSPLTGKPDKPENYHEVTYDLTAQGEGKTKVVCTQTNNPTPESAEHSEANWKMMLENLKKVAER
jgi:uncharacterized protein YndB with AHSA1/START domain